MREDSWMVTDKDSSSDSRRAVDSWILPTTSKSNSNNGGYSRNLNQNNGNNRNMLTSRSARAPIDSWNVPLTRQLPPTSSPALPSYNDTSAEQHTNQLSSNSPIAPTRDYHNNGAINNDTAYSTPSNLNRNPSTNRTINPLPSHPMPNPPHHQFDHGYNHRQPSFERNEAAYPTEQVAQPKLPSLNGNGSQRRYLHDNQQQQQQQQHYQNHNNNNMTEHVRPPYEPYNSQPQMNHNGTHNLHTNNGDSADDNADNVVGAYGQPYRNHGSLFSEADSSLNKTLRNNLHKPVIQATPVGATSNRWMSYTAEEARNDAWRDEPATPVPPPSSSHMNQYQINRPAPPPPITTATHQYHHRSERASPVSPVQMIIPRMEDIPESNTNNVVSPSLSTRNLYTAPSNTIHPFTQPVPTYLGSKDDRKHKKERSFCAQFCSFLCCCCCFRRCCSSRRSCFCTCLIIFLVLGVCLGVAAYFLWPRMPEARFVSASMSSINPNNQAVGEQVQLPQWSNGVITMNVVFVLNVKSDNYISLKVNNITVDGFMRPSNMGNSSKSISSNSNSTEASQNMTRIPVGHGSLPSEITFPGRSSVNFKLAYLLSFNTNEQSQIPAFYELLDACGVTGNTKRKMRLEYDAKVDLAVVSSLGIRPSISDKIDLDCPYEAGVLVQMSQTRTLLRSIGPQFGLSQSRINAILAGRDDST